MKKFEMRLLFLYKLLFIPILLIMITLLFLGLFYPNILKIQINNPILKHYFFDFYILFLVISGMTLFLQTMVKNINESTYVRIINMTGILSFISIISYFPLKTINDRNVFVVCLTSMTILISFVNLTSNQKNKCHNE